MSSHHYLSATLTSRSDWNNVLPLPSIQLQVLDESCSSRDARLGLLSHHTISFRCYFSVATRVGTRGPPERREGGLGASRSVDGADERRGGTIDRRIFHPFCLGFFFFMVQWVDVNELFCVSRRKKKTKNKKDRKDKKESFLAIWTVLIEIVRHAPGAGDQWSFIRENWFMSAYQFWIVYARLFHDHFVPGMEPMEMSPEAHHSGQKALERELLNGRWLRYSRRHVMKMTPSLRPSPPSPFV